MTTERPTRLADQNPEFARLVAASEKEIPASSQIEKALSLADHVTATSRWATYGWLGAGLTIGLAAVGAVFLSIATPTGVARSGEAVVVPAVAPITTTAAAGSIGVDEPPPSRIAAATPVTTVSVNDLASAPAPAIAAPARRPETLPRVEPSPSASEAMKGSRTTFDEELALVSAARAALERNDVPSCMRAVRSYRERFGSGTFAHEIEVIRIETLFASGEHARACTAAEQFLGTNTKSPYADRLRSLLVRCE